jgi:hypothetical protein
LKESKSSIYAAFCFAFLGLGVVGSANGMGLRSFVALPIEKEGAVLRLTLEHAENADTKTLTNSAAYGISANQTLLLGLPYLLSPANSNRLGDVSVLYRHIVLQKDSLSGTNRLGLLGGVIMPTDNARDAALQSGVVFTHFQNRHEIDVDVIYQVGLDNRSDSGRYDVSWQYRLFPSEHPDWGIAQEMNSVLELNGRWVEGSKIIHQVTAGIQWVHQKWVIEGGVTRDIKNGNELRYVLSTRIHF